MVQCKDKKIQKKKKKSLNISKNLEIYILRKVKRQPKNP